MKVNIFFQMKPTCSKETLHKQRGEYLAGNYLFKV